MKLTRYHNWRRGFVDMARSTFGQLQEFQPESETIAAYLERASLYFQANSIAEEKQVAVFLSVIGAKNYSLLRCLTAPERPQDKSYEDLVSALTTHFQPKPIVIAERFHFYRRNQAVGESLAQYIAELRRLATHCAFGEQLNDALRDRLVCGLRSESIQKRLLTEDNLTFAKAYDLAQGMEAADKNSKSLQGGDGIVQKIIRPSQKPKDKGGREACYRCGKQNHTAKECRFLDAKCHNCGKKGHIATVCRSKPAKSNANRRNPWTKYVDSKDSDAEDHQLLTIGEKSTRPITIELLINNKPLTMEVDTGAAVSLISEATMKKLLPRMKVQPSNMTLKTYTKEQMKVLGKIEVNVEYGEQKEVLTLIVVKGNGPSLLGRNWLNCIRLDWKRIAAVTAVQDTNLQSLLERYANLFKEDLGTITSYQAKLRIRKDATPRFYKPRPVPFAIKTAIEEELDRLEAIGAIVKVDHSDWASPIVPVPKKDGKYRICGDYKVTINQGMEVDQYPLPKPEDLFATLAGGKKFTKLDLSQAYQQLTLDKESRKYVTINTHKGLYQYTRLPFGVASAPAIFQRLMDTILQNIPNVICYIDDILVTGKDDQDHLCNLASVFKQLQKYNIHIKKAKCEILQNSVEYLGHKIDAEGLHTTNSKLEAIVHAPEPRNIQELRSFLGLLNYYGKFIPNLATIIHPLNNLLQHNCKWQWTSECSEAFQEAKKALTTSQVLVHYDPTLPLSLAGDASAYGIGAVISHTLPDGSERPIAFASRTLSSSERNYAQLEKEALSLIYGVKKFHQYLYGRKFTLYTDHKPLTAIFGAKKGIPPLAAARLQRWAILLSAYQFNIEYKSTLTHANADGLSRLPLPDSREDAVVSSREPTIFNLSQIQTLPVTAVQIETATRNDPVLSKVLTYTRGEWPRVIPHELKPFSTRSQELTLEGDCIMWGIRVIIPKKFQNYVLEELHNEHIGMSRMKSLARSYVWWPGLDKDIEDLAKSCLACQSHKHAPAVAPLHPWTWPTSPWNRIHIDFAGPFQGKMFLIVVDAHSKWPEVFEMSSTTVPATIATLRRIFSSYGLPQQLVSDNGPQFTSEEFCTFLKENGVKHIRCSPYHPSSNGLAERFVQTFKQAMKAGTNSNRSFQHRLANFLFRYRTTPHATTNRAPCMMFLNRSLRSRFDLLKPNPKERVMEKQAEQARHHDPHSTSREMIVGQNVMARNFCQGEKWIPGVIVKRLGPLTYLIELKQGLRWKRHIDHLRKWNGSYPPNNVMDDAFMMLPSQPRTEAP